MIKDEAFLDLEASLLSEVLPVWIKANKVLASKLAEAIDLNDTAVISELLGKFDPELFIKGKTKKVKFLIKSLTYFGATRISQLGPGLHIKGDSGVDEFILRGYEQYKASLSYAWSKMELELMDAVMKAAQVAEELKVAVQKSDTNIIAILEEAGKRIGVRNMGIATTLQASRMAVYGMAAEATARGITTYVVNEVLDGKTCPVCRMMHGREFKVVDALEKMETVLSVDSVEDFASLAPFPSQKPENVAKLGEMTGPQLKSLGYDTPPYHPGCRGLITIKSKLPDLSSAAPLAGVQGLPEIPNINPQVAEFLESPEGQALSQDARDFVIGASAGIVDTNFLPQSVQELIESLS